MGLELNLMRDRYMRRLSRREEIRRQKEDEQAMKDYNARMKFNETIAKMNLAASLFNTANKARTTVPTLKLQETFGPDSLTQQLKYQLKEGPGIGAYLPWNDEFDPKKAIKKDIGRYFSPLEKTPEYEKFLLTGQKKEAAEELKRARKTVPLAEEEWEDYYDDTVNIEDPGFTEFGEFEKAPPLPPGMGTAPETLPGFTFDPYTLSKMLKESGVTLPENMSKDNVIRIYTALEKIIEEGDSKDYKAFVATLKQGTANPDLFEAVVKDLTENTDETIDQIQEGTYTPGQDPTAKIPAPPAKPDVPLADEYELFDEGQDAPLPTPTLEVEPLPPPSGELVSPKKPLATSIDPLRNRLIPQYDEYGSWTGGQHMTPREVMEYKAERSPVTQASTEWPEAQPIRRPDDTGITIPDVSGVETPLPMESLYDKPGIKAGLQRLLPGGETGMETFEEGMERSMMEGWEAGAGQAGQDTSPFLASTGMVDVPSAETGIFQKGFVKAKKLGTMENIQNINKMINIGKTIGNENATGVEKGVAAIEGTRMLADLVAKQAGQETVSQIGSKAALQYATDKGLQEGVKLTGKQAVGTAAGGVLGGYEMVKEAEEASEAWGEQDYDEAILHGIGSVSGGLQTAGAGMMLTGVGAPLGAVLYGVGTAASVVSDVGLLIEGLFGGGGGAAPAPEGPKRDPRLKRYYDRIMEDRPEYGYNPKQGRLYRR